MNRAPTMADSHERHIMSTYWDQQRERLEHYARLAPYNWFNFYDYWADKPSPHPSQLSSHQLPITQ